MHQADRDAYSFRIHGTSAPAWAGMLLPNQYPYPEEVRRDHIHLKWFLAEEIQQCSDGTISQI